MKNISPSVSVSSGNHLAPDRAVTRSNIGLGVFFAILILIVAAIGRLGWPGVVEFKIDESALSKIALDLVHGHGFPLLGINSSVGIPNSPMSVYLMAIPYSLSTSPVVATAFVGLLNVIAVVMLYFLTWRYYGLIAAVIAAGLYAVDPWAILFSRKIWEQDLLPIFVIATVATGLIGLIEGKRWAQWLHLPLLLITGQLHYGTFVLIPVTLWLIVIGIYQKKIRRAFFGGFVIAVLLTLPYVIGLGQNGLLDLTKLRTIIASANPDTRTSTLTLTTTGFHDASLVIGGGEVYSLAGDSYLDFLTATPAVQLPVPTLIDVAVIIASLWMIGQTIRHVRSAETRRPINVAILLWLIITPLVYSLTWTPIFTHYYIAMIPGAFIVLGAGLADMWRKWITQQRLHQIIAIVGIISVIGIIVTESAVFFALLGFVDTHVTPNGFGTPLHDLMPIRQQVLDSGASSVLVNLDGQYMLIDPEATVWNTLLDPIPTIRFVDAQTEVFPATPALLFSKTCQGLAGDVALIAGQTSCFSLTPRRSTDFNDTSYTPIHVSIANPSQQFDNGAILIGYQWHISRDSSTHSSPAPCLALAWQISSHFIPNPSASDAQDYHFAVHFTNIQDQEIAIADALSWRTKFWQPGDIIVRTFCLSDVTKAAAITGVRLGMYVYDGQTFHNANLTDSRGIPIGQSVLVHFNPMF